MRPTSHDHRLAITEALNSPAVKEQLTLREAIPHMYLLNLKCDCISVQPKHFRFRVTMDYSLIRNNEIPAHEDIVVIVDVQRQGPTPEAKVVGSK